MPDGGDDVGQFIRNWVQVARQRHTLAPPVEPPALGDAYRLLSDEELEWAVESAGLAYTGEGRWPRYDNGQCMLPDRRNITLHARKFVLNALGDGRLCARAIDPDDPIRGKPFTIPARLWPLLTPDWERSTATCEGKLVAIGITVSAEQGSDHQQPAPPVSPAELENWFTGWKCRQSADVPGQHAAVAAAKAVFGARVTRARVVAVYNKHVPVWKRRPGRPRKN